MLGLQDYGSDNSADSSDERSEDPRAISSVVQSNTKQTSSLPSATLPALPDATSLFSSTVDASVPWQGSVQHKRAGTAAEVHSAKAQKTAPLSTPLGQQHQARQRGNASRLLPPQLRGRANASTEDLDRFGLRRSKPQPSKPS